jgi:hypothetical protein
MAKERRHNYYIRYNPKIRKNAVFPDDFPGFKTRDDVVMKLRDDGLLDVFSAVNFADDDEFLAKIVPKIEDFEREVMRERDVAAEHIASKLKSEASTLGALLARARLLHDGESKEAGEIAGRLCKIRAALTALAAPETQREENKPGLKGGQFKEGQEVFMTNVLIRQKREAEKGKVTKIGRKYITVKIGMHEYRFDKETLIEEQGIGDIRILHPSREALNEHIEADETRRFLSDAFKYGDDCLPIEKLREIRIAAESAMAEKEGDCR